MVTPSASVAPTGHLQSASTALLTDHYELTMLQAALRSGEAHRRCVFETFTRRLPEGRRYAVLAGTGRFLDALEQFRFGEAEIADLRARNEQLAQRATQLRAERDHVTRLNRRLLKPSIPRRVVHRLRCAVGKLAR